MIKCSNVRLSKEFFNSYYDEINNDEELYKIFHFFKNRKIGYTENEAPMTDYKKQLIDEQRPAYIQYLFKKPNHFSDKKLSSTQIFDMAKIYASKNYLSSNFTITEFGKNFKQLMGSYVKKSNGIMLYKFPCLIELKKKLYELDSKYYKYINNFEDDEEPDFTTTEEEEHELMF